MGNMEEYPQNTATAGGRAKEETQPDGGAEVCRAGHWQIRAVKEEKRENV